MTGGCEADHIEKEQVKKHRLSLVAGWNQKTPKSSYCPFEPLASLCGRVTVLECLVIVPLKLGNPEFQASLG